MADVTGPWAAKPVDIWHDRAVFHFLTDASDRANYLGQLRRHLKPDGTAIIATFGPDGPEKCVACRSCATRRIPSLPNSART